MKKLSLILIQELINEHEDYSDSVLKELLEENKKHLTIEEQNLIIEHLKNKEGYENKN